MVELVPSKVSVVVLSNTVLCTLNLWVTKIPIGSIHHLGYVVVPDVRPSLEQQIYISNKSKANNHEVLYGEGNVFL